MPETFDAQRFVSVFTSSMNKKDAQTLLGHYTANAELKDPSVETPVHGTDAIRQNFEMWSAAFSELDFKITSTVRNGNNVALLIDAQARHTGPLELAPGEEVPATNKAVRLEMAQFLTLDNEGKITKDHTIFDMASMMMQLGLLPGAKQEERGRTSTTRMPGASGR